MRGLVLEQRFPGERAADDDVLIIGPGQKQLAIVAPENGVHAALVHLEGSPKVHPLDEFATVFACAGKPLSELFLPMASSSLVQRSKDTFVTPIPSHAWFLVVEFLFHKNKSH